MHHRPAHHPASEFAGRTSFILRKYNEIYLAPIAAALFLLSGCDNAQNASPQQMTQEVGVVTLHGQPVPVVSSLTGRTTASLSAEVRPQVGGIVQKRLFTEGDMVKAGQALYQIDPSSSSRDV